MNADREPIIHTTGLTKRFGDFTAVSDLALEVRRGSIFAFLGANGSGKSTTIRMLIGLLRPTDGTVSVDGIDVIRAPRQVRERIGYMGQKVSLYQGLSLRENVEFYAGLYGLTGRDLTTRWGGLSERFGLRHVERDRAQDLSAGVRQRAGLALATLHRPRVLFLDEPTAGVDVYHRRHFWELIQHEARAGVTVFVTTHFLEEADYCDWVSFIHAGRLIANADPEALRTQFSDGYRAEIRCGAGQRANVLRLLSTGGGAGERCRERGDGVDLHAPSLAPALLARLAALRSAGAAVTVHQPPMTDVFRRVLLAAAQPEAA